jgi:hypothetical protein
LGLFFFILPLSFVNEFLDGIAAGVFEMLPPAHQLPRQFGPTELAPPEQCPVGRGGPLNLPPGFQVQFLDQLRRQGDLIFSRTISGGAELELWSALGGNRFRPAKERISRLRLGSADGE